MRYRQNQMQGGLLEDGFNIVKGLFGIKTPEQKAAEAYQAQILSMQKESAANTQKLITTAMYGGLGIAALIAVSMVIRK
jgi:hypothetical protein